MAIIRQTLGTVAVLLMLGVVALWAFETPGRLLLSHRDSLPGPLVRLVEAVSRGGETRVGATPAQDSDALSRMLVVTDPAVADRTRDRLRVIGTGQALSSVAIQPDASGLVQDIRLRSGDTVEAGQILAVLQDDAERVEVDRRRIALEAAQDQVRRFRTLLDSSSITSVQFDEVRRAADAAMLDLRAAEIALSDRQIRAPISGRVGIVTIEPGSYVSNTTLIATVDDRSRIRMRIEIPEAYVSQLAIGHPVSAVPTTRDGQRYSGEITALDNRLDETSRTLRAEATIDNQADGLRPGMSFAVDIGFEGQDYISVDALAIQWERAGAYVWTVTDGRAAKVPVEIIERNVDRVLVAAEGLAPGQPVVTEGVQQLRDGVPVRVEDPDALPDVPQTPEAGPTVDREAPSGSGRAALAGPDRPRLAHAAGAEAAR
ncbi:efflux RND transporter periplasmic adaptor subunit [Aureimonas frigidaquae]|uniref:efflux RND transporter periplasmic adaptor subunit n=1 Tax=Aureimonas frigidaquae TaxID=424757 RepID=UPI000B067C5A|nr:efflux RND transporter periplasmic adaptor subunit [Aureimonas frigidaquae]